MMESERVIVVGYPRKRTERTAMTEAARLANNSSAFEWHGVSAIRRGDGWYVTVALTRPDRRKG